jgi:hypothetical protein
MSDDRSLQKQVRRSLEERFGGWSVVGNRPLRGAWRNPSTGKIEYDESWRYEVGLTRNRLRALDDYLADLATELGQVALWRVVVGEGRAIHARPKK